MAAIKVNKDYTNLNNGSYTGTVDNALLCKNGKIMLKIALKDGTYFVSFHEEDAFGRLSVQSSFHGSRYQ